MFLLARQPAAPSELQIFGWTGYKHDAPTAFEAFSPPRATYIQRPHERSADESRQTPALLSPRTRARLFITSANASTLPALSRARHRATSLGLFTSSARSRSIR